ncbi:MAG TPA: 4Fe-4S dicluster domain-containing protein [Acidobacteriota bacterium]|nr:4Fe-4S dicluster domain-containing protein [Acidobacteriota bacterium]
MTNFGFIIDNRKCIGCHACTVACKQEHDLPIGVNRTWVKYIEKGTFPNTRRIFAVQRCNHCADAPCVEICPVTALWKRKDGIVDFDGERCIGCKACMQACPYDAIYLHPDTNTAAKCNYCAHRVAVSLQPPCVTVCPEHAIIAGDMEDPATEIAQMLSRLAVQVRKPEKGTNPQLYYIEGDEASLNPTYSSTPEGYLWSEIPQRVYQIAPPRLEEAESEARRVYDQGQSHTNTWGFRVAAYLWTKSIAAGIPLLALIVSAISGRLRFGALEIITSLVFLLVTTILLIMDLKQPARFHFIIFRPQWKSWLTRGAFILIGFGLLLSLCFLFEVLVPIKSVLLFIFPVTVLFGIGSAVYSAFLFGQAKGRDFWQSPLFGVHLLVMSLLAGSAVMIMLDDRTPWIDTILQGSLIAHLLLIFFDLTAIHSTHDAKLAASMMKKDRLFWIGGILIGIVVPLIGLSFGILGLSGLFALVGLLLYEKVWVKVGQLIPLS